MVSFPVFAVMVLTGAVHPVVAALLELLTNVPVELRFKVPDELLVELTGVVLDDEAKVPRLVPNGTLELLIPPRVVLLAGMVLVDEPGMPEALAVRPPEALPDGMLEVAPEPPVPLDPSQAAAAKTKPIPTPVTPVIQRSNWVMHISIYCLLLTACCLLLAAYCRLLSYEQNAGGIR